MRLNWELLITSHSCTMLYLDMLTCSVSHMCCMWYHGDVWGSAEITLGNGKTQNKMKKTKARKSHIISQIYFLMTFCIWNRVLKTCDYDFVMSAVSHVDHPSLQALVSLVFPWNLPYLYLITRKVIDLLLLQLQREAWERRLKKKKKKKQTKQPLKPKVYDLVKNSE